MFYFQSPLSLFTDFPSSPASSLAGSGFCSTFGGFSLAPNGFAGLSLLSPNGLAFLFAVVFSPTFFWNGEVVDVAGALTGGLRGSFEA